MATIENGNNGENLETTEQIKKYFSYGDAAINDGQKRKAFADALAADHAHEYAAEIVKLSKEIGIEPVVRLANELRSDLYQKAGALHIEMTPYANSISWAMWSIARERFDFRHQDNVEEKNRKRLGDPITSKRKQNEIMRRHLGWETHVAYRQHRLGADALIPSGALPYLIKDPKVDGQLSSDELVKLGIVLDRDAKKRIAESNRVTDHAADPDFINILNVSNDHQDEAATTPVDTIESVSIPESELEDQLRADADGNIRTTGMRDAGPRITITDPHIDIDPVISTVEPAVETITPVVEEGEPVVATIEPIATPAARTDVVRPRTEVTPVRVVAPETTTERPVLRLPGAPPILAAMGIASFSVLRAGASVVATIATLYLGTIKFVADSITDLSISIMTSVFTKGKEGITKFFKGIFAGGGDSHDTHGKKKDDHGDSHAKAHTPAKAHAPAKKEAPHAPAKAGGDHGHH